MSQAKVTNYYSTRKKRGNLKNESIQQDKTKTVKKVSAFFDKPLKSPSKRSSRNLNENLIDQQESPSKKTTRSVNVIPSDRRKNLQIERKNLSDQQKSSQIVDENLSDLPKSPSKSSQIVKEDLSKAVISPSKRSSQVANENLLDSKKKKYQSVSSDLQPPSTQTLAEEDTSKLARVRKKLVLTDSGSTSAVPKEDNENSSSVEKDTPAAEQVIKSKLHRTDPAEILKRHEDTYKKLLNYHQNCCKSTSVILPESSRKSVIPDVEVEVAEVSDTPPAASELYNLSSSQESSLVLPQKYSLLLNIFRCTDTVVSMYHNRKEVCTFGKLKKGVQNMIKRKFTEQHLGQIKSVFPSAYDIVVEKATSAAMNRNADTPRAEIVVYPNLTEYKEGNTAVKSKTVEKNASTSGSLLISMTAAILVERKKKFQSMLLNIVVKYHQDFLAEQKPPVNIPVSKLFKWHSKFREESVPDIKPSPLPKLQNKQKVSSAKDVLTKLAGVNCKRIKNVLETVASKTTPEVEEKKPSVESTKDAKVKTGSLKGIKLDILQKIRAKEAAKVLHDMTRSPQQQKRLEMLERLPRIVSILNNYYVTEKRTTLPFEQVIKKVRDSYLTTISSEMVRGHILFLSDLSPDWLKLAKIPQGEFLKMNKGKNTEDILKTIPKT